MTKSPLGKAQDLRNEPDRSIMEQTEKIMEDRGKGPPPKVPDKFKSDIKFDDLKTPDYFKELEEYEKKGDFSKPFEKSPELRAKEQKAWKEYREKIPSWSKREDAKTIVEPWPAGYKPSEAEKKEYHDYMERRKAGDWDALDPTSVPPDPLKPHKMKEPSYKAKPQPSPKAKTVHKYPSRGRKKKYRGKSKEEKD